MVNKMNDDTISRQAAIDALDGEFNITGRENAETIRDYINSVNKKLRELPSAERRGRWKGERLIYPSGIITFIYRCSECGYEERHAYEDTKPSNYCPNCGARMVEDGTD